MNRRHHRNPAGRNTKSLRESQPNGWVQVISSSVIIHTMEAIIEASMSLNSEITLKSICPIVRCNNNQVFVLSAR
jgi:hypothetical protein